MAHVINKIERVSKALIDQFREIGSATVHEAYGRKGAVNPAIKPELKAQARLYPPLGPCTSRISPQK